MTKQKSSTIVHGMEISRKKYLHNRMMKQMKSQLFTRFVKSIFQTVLEEVDVLQKTVRTLENFNPTKEMQRVQNALRVVQTIDSVVKDNQCETDIQPPSCPKELQTLIDSCNEHQPSTTTSKSKHLSVKLTKVMASKYISVLDDRKSSLLEYIGWLKDVNLKERKHMCKNWIAAL